MSSVPRNSEIARFELLVRLLRAADEPDRGQPVAPVVEGLVRGLDDLGMIGQAEVIVGAHVQDVGPALRRRRGPAGARSGPARP